jgi:hypothetical protein
MGCEEGRLRELVLDNVYGDIWYSAVLNFYNLLNKIRDQNNPAGSLLKFKHGAPPIDIVECSKQHLMMF